MHVLRAQADVSDRRSVIPACDNSLPVAKPRLYAQQLTGRDLRFSRKDSQQRLIFQHIIEDRRGKPRRARDRADRRRREPGYVEEASYAAGVVRQELKKVGDNIFWALDCHLQTVVTAAWASSQVL
jgi:hypothetical protein